MGQKLSILAQTTPYIDISSYINIIQDLQFIKNLNNNSKFISTNKCISVDNDRTVVIAKVFIKPDQFENNSSNITRDNSNDPLNINLIIQYLIEEREKLKDIKNVIHYPHILNLSRSTYLFRPFLLQTLSERISPHNTTNNRLELIEIKFIIFQILKTLFRVHEAGVIHGNITPNNILVTAMDNAVLTDFSYFLKPFYLPEDNPNEYDFYFGRNTVPDSSSLMSPYDLTELGKTNNLNAEISKVKEMSGIKVNIQKGTNRANKYAESKGFYIAPERLDSKKRNATQQLLIFDQIKLAGEDLTKCDIFSVGCVIFEILAILHNTGQKLFSFQEIFKFKNNNLSFFEDKLAYLNSIDSFSADLIRDCCNLRPKDRLSSEQLLAKYRGTFFPDFFYTDVYTDNIEILSDFECLDFKFQDFCNNFEDTCFNMGVPVLKQVDGRSENEVFQNYDFVKFFNDKELIILQKFENFNYEQNVCIKTNSALIYINTFGKLLRIFDSVKDLLLCLDCLIIMSQYVSDRLKLDLVLPYLMSFFVNTSDSTCRSFALNKIVQLFSIIGHENNSALNDSLCYYVFPLLNKILNNNSLDTTSTITVINVLPKLIEHATLNNKFLKKSINSIVGILLIEEDIDCKVILLEQLPHLVKFIGKTVSNDLILSHLITYLNESSVKVRVALIKCLCKISPYLGQISFQEFIYPLLLQNLYLLPDQKDLILTVLENLHKIITDDSGFVVNKQIINFKTLIEEHVVHFLLLPNEQLKQAAIQLLKDIIIDKSDLSERYCLYYPVIKSYYHMNMEIDEQLLQMNCRSSVSEEQFQYLFIWAMSYKEKNSLFWKEKTSSADNSFDFQYNNYVNPDEMNQYLSMDDKLYIDTFIKKYKLDLYQVWKLAKLRKYVKRIIKSVSLNLRNEYIESKPKKDVNRLIISTHNTTLERKTNINTSSMNYRITYTHPGSGLNNRRKSTNTNRYDSTKLISQKLLNDALRNVNESNVSAPVVSGKINGSSKTNANALVNIIKTSYRVDKTIDDTADDNILNFIESVKIKPQLANLSEIVNYNSPNQVVSNIVPQRMSTLSNLEKFCDYGDTVDKIIANDKYIAITTIDENTKYILIYDIYNFNTMNITKHNQYSKKIDISLLTISNDVLSKIHDIQFWNNDILVISFENGVFLLLKILDNLDIGILKETKLLNGNGEYCHIIKTTPDRILILTSYNRFFDYDYVENSFKYLFTWTSKVIEDAYDENATNVVDTYEVIIDFIQNESFLILITSMNNVYVFDLEYLVLRNLYQLYEHRNMKVNSYLPLTSVNLHGNDQLIITGGYDISVLFIFNFNDLTHLNESSSGNVSNIISAKRVILNSNSENFTTDDDLYDKFILKKYEAGTKHYNPTFNDLTIGSKTFYNFITNNSDIITFYDSYSQDVSYIDFAKDCGEVLFTNTNDVASNTFYKRYNLNNYLKLYYRSKDSHSKKNGLHSINNNITNTNIILSRFIYLENGTSMLLLATVDGYFYCYTQDA